MVSEIIMASALAADTRMITIIDYGMGNLRSVQKAFEAVGARAEITHDPDVVSRAERLVLPGVGAFADAIKALQESGLGPAFVDVVRRGQPCLGVCLGLQLLFEESEEDGLHRGLGLIAGRIVRFRPPRDARIKVPHMGWNRLTIDRPAPLFTGLPAQPWVYFVHSYYAEPTNTRDVAATSDYPEPFAAVVWRDNLVACQFHPEKSQAMGLAMYANFAKA
jgi:glutamine amidotransferase